jgi:hypothetical protein
MGPLDSSSMGETLGAIVVEDFQFLAVAVG